VSSKRLAMRSWKNSILAKAYNALPYTQLASEVVAS
jgi:hypothetical protein